MSTFEERIAVLGSLFTLALIPIGFGQLILPVFALFMLIVTGSMWFRRRKHDR